MMMMIMNGDNADEGVDDDDGDADDDDCEW